MVKQTGLLGRRKCDQKIKKYQIIQKVKYFGMPCLAAVRATDLRHHCSSVFFTAFVYWKHCSNHECCL